MKISHIFELTPKNGRKSFYGKAKVLIGEGRSFLKSYDTIMCGVDRDGNVHRYSDHKSNTTCTHLKSYLTDENYSGFWDLPLEEKPSLVVEL